MNDETVIFIIFIIIIYIIITAKSTTSLWNLFCQTAGAFILIGCMAKLLNINNYQQTQPEHNLAVPRYPLPTHTEQLWAGTNPDIYAANYIPLPGSENYPGYPYPANHQVENLVGSNLKTGSDYGAGYGTYSGTSSGSATPAENIYQNNPYTTSPMNTTDTYGQFYTQHQAYNESYTTAYPARVPYIAYSASERTLGIDSATAALAARRSRDKQCMDGFVSKDAHYYKYNYADELDREEKKRWWGNNDY
jgi:hypothetical protein